MQHTRIRTKTVSFTETVTICDRCGRKMISNDQDCEHQERLAVRFSAGYGSVFGDGSLVEGDFCQQCVKEVLGSWLRVTEDDPFDPAHKLDGEPKGAYQAYQSREVLEAEWLVRALMEALQRRNEG
ncbi:MAG: hypothetical protein ABL877_04325 [Thiobacillus sp.]